MALVCCNSAAACTGCGRCAESGVCAGCKKPFLYGDPYIESENGPVCADCAANLTEDGGTKRLWGIL